MHKQNQKDTEANGWPIYALADYDGTGSLLELCRSMLAQASNLKHQITSDYHTQDSKIKLLGVGVAAPPNRPDQNQLSWRQLIEIEAATKLEPFRESILRLCSGLHAAVSPFIVTPSRSWPMRPISATIATHSRSLQAESPTTDVGVASDGEGRSTSCSMLEGRLSPASIRRLSWRRQVARKEPLGERRLTAMGRTFSKKTSSSAFKLDNRLAGNDISAITHKWNKQTHKESTQFKGLLENWLELAGNEKHSIGMSSSRRRRACRWSKGTKARGKYGESLVHILLVNHTNDHLVLLILLLQIWPQLVEDIFESRKFKAVCVEQQVTGSLFRLPDETGRSESAQSVAKKNNKIADTQIRDNELFWCDCLSNWPTANGGAHYFLFDRILARRFGSKVNSPSDLDSEHMVAQPIYLGHSPLAWSVTFSQRTMCEMLVASGAQCNSRDSMGNTCLHLLVINEQLNWARYLVKLGADIEATNEHQLSPFLLACHLGCVRLFNELLELSAVEFWSYSAVRCCGYPLVNLDSILVAACERSAVSVILESHQSDNEQKSALLSSAVVKKLLEEKWRHFARRLFYRSLAMTLCHLFLLSLAISLRPTRNGATKTTTTSTIGSDTDFMASFRLLQSIDRWTLVRHSSELATVTLSANQLIRFGLEWRRYGNVALLWAYNPMLSNLIAGNVLVALCVPMRLATEVATSPLARRAEDVALIFAAPLLWSSLLFHIAAFRVTGPFVAMIRYMIVRDLRQFSAIYLVFLYSFAQCIFFVNYRHSAPEVSSAPSTKEPIIDEAEADFLWSLLADYAELWMELFKMTLGVYDLQPYRHSTLARLFFLLFIYLIPILFNMLIAMMNNTYSLIISQSERAWSFQWARTLFALERSLSDDEKRAYLRKYAINMAASKSADVSDSSKVADEFVPALMIIKRMDFTRAEQRRRLVGYWQRSIRATLEQVKRARASSDIYARDAQPN